jgi:hypothetical protein
MSEFFRIIFNNRYCCGYISALIIILTGDVFKLYSNWWLFIPVIIIFYLGFKYLAYKYLDE